VNEKRRALPRKTEKKIVVAIKGGVRAVQLSRDKMPTTGKILAKKPCAGVPRARQHGKEKGKMSQNRKINIRNCDDKKGVDRDLPLVETCQLIRKTKRKKEKPEMKKKVESPRPRGENSQAL